MNKRLYGCIAAAFFLGGCSAGVGTQLVSTEQVLTEADFNRIVPGQWTRADVERAFGSPARIESVASWSGPIMTYRWRDRANANMLYSIYLDTQGVVRRAHPSMEVRDRLFDFRF
jgi:hypothetical protein